MHGFVEEEKRKYIDEHTSDGEATRVRARCWDESSLKMQSARRRWAYAQGRYGEGWGPAIRDGGGHNTHRADRARDGGVLYGIDGADGYVRLEHEGKGVKNEK